WEKWEFDQEGSSFKLKDEQPLYNGHFKFATPEQLKILEQSKTLADALNVAAEQGLNIIRTYSGGSVAPMYKLKELFPVVRFNEKENEFVPDLERIAHIR